MEHVVRALACSDDASLNNVEPGFSNMAEPALFPDSKGFSEGREPCSVPLLDWTGDKLFELIQGQAHILPAQMLCEGAAEVSSGVARRGRSEAVTERLRGRRPLPLVAVHPKPGAFCHE